MIGRIHSIETMGLMDGPGIRFVVFFQGCKLRCAYCHNPDTWYFNAGARISAEDLLQKALKYKIYFDKSGGGVTCSGGEPLMQPEFLIEFLKLCKANGLHTSIDTAGFGIGRYPEILEYTDLVILDIKHVDKARYQELTGGNIEEFMVFVQSLDKADIKVWIRHVVVPGLTDTEEHVRGIRRISSQIRNVEKIELLPYHTLGVHKYKKMKIPYKLNGVKPMSEERLKELEKVLGIV
jgi:pyruvate formate lyase activating enzyme